MAAFVRLFSGLLFGDAGDSPQAPTPIPPPVAPALPKEVDQATKQATKDQEEIAKNSVEENIRARRKSQKKNTSLYNLDEPAPEDILGNKGAF